MHNRVGIEVYPDGNGVVCSSMGKNCRRQDAGHVCVAVHRAETSIALECSTERERGYHWSTLQTSLECMRWLTLVNSATHPEGSHPFSSLRLGSNSSAAAVTAPKSPASMEAASAKLERLSEHAHRTAASRTLILIIGCWLFGYCWPR